MSLTENDGFVDSLGYQVEKAIHDGDEKTFMELMKVLDERGYAFAADMYRKEWSDGQELKA